MTRRGRRAATFMPLGLVLLALGGQRAITCWGPHWDSVHFNNSVPDFGMPPQDIVVPKWVDAPLRPGTIDTSNRVDDTGAREGNARRLAEQAKGLERKRRYRAAIRVYRQLEERRLGECAFWQDRIEVLTETLRLGRPRGLGAYIAARDVYESGQSGGGYPVRVRRRMEAIAADRRARFLRAHALYTIAAMDYDAKGNTTVAAQFERCAERYPHSPRAESALIMAARTLLEDMGPTDECTALDRKEGTRVVGLLLSRFPRTRFKADAIGWLGRAAYLEGRYDKALAYYRRQLEVAGPRFRIYDSMGITCLAKGRRGDAFATYLRAFLYTNKEMAAVCLHRLQLSFSAKDAGAVGVRLRREPDLLQPYVEFRLHLTATDRGDLANLVSLSRDCLKRHPDTRLAASILARLAEIEYAGGRFASARSFAARSLRTPGQGHDLALFVYAGTTSRLRRFGEAANEFRRLIREYPSSFLVGGARENLALACERTGRLGEALDQYSRLDYAWDLAYMLDVRMPPAQVEAFLRAYPAHKLHKQAVYSLGLRYLRKDRFVLAERWLSRLTRRERLTFAGLLHKRDHEYDLGYDDGERLFDPLQTARDLERLHRRCHSPGSSGAKARGLYALASYYHRRRNLLLYNPSLWNGARATAYEMYWNTDVATREDDSAWRRHCYEHECLARSRALCLEILRRYPRSSVAPKAAYTGAVACYRLSKLNDWWRGEDKRVGLGRQAVRLMKLVVARYPKARQAKAAAKFAEVYAAEISAQERDNWYERER